ncbi:MAG: PD-(D/E)XK nuclease family protein [Candidatus Moranbacteria bacterium]|nr:PD-(D/E)XK nuclease family protein [Candidatus Moranbacteria bacterium]
MEEKIPMSIEKKDAPKKNFLEIACPYCFGANFVKRGTRQKKNEIVQLYLCNDCQKTFTPGATKGKHYSISVILDAISLYYLGYSLEESARRASRIVDVNKASRFRDCSVIESTSHSRSSSEVADKGQSSHSRDCSVIESKGQEGTKDIPLSADNIGSGTDNIGSGTLLNWITQYEPLCAFARMRPFAIKLFKPQDVISSATLAHRQLYRFRHHRAKTILIIQEDWKHSKFWPLKEFLDLVPVECPHQYFSEGARASETPLMFSKTEMIVRGKHNFANKMAKFVLESVEQSKDRHDALQRFMLANDSVTIATEVPIYLRREDLAHMQTQLGFQLFAKVKNRKSQIPISKSQANSNNQNSNDKNKEGEDKIVENNELRELLPDEIPKLITGHIDFVQIRNGQIHILDYKPNATKERPIEQLTIYALALSRLTGLKVFNFKCAWFDEKDYFEFFPLHVVYKPGKKRKRRNITTIEGNYKLNDNPKKVEQIRPGIM